jgi:hypothetical protein
LDWRIQHFKPRTNPHLQRSTQDCRHALIQAADPSQTQGARAFFDEIEPSRDPAEEGGIGRLIDGKIAHLRIRIMNRAAVAAQ